MRYLPINKSFFVKNREALVTQLKKGGIAILLSNDIYPTNADGTFPFKQNNDLFYLTGIDQEDTLLVLFPDATENKHKTVLFIRETNDHIAIWEGAKLTKEEARELSGIDTVYWEKDFEKIVHALLLDAQTIYLNANEHGRAEKSVQTKEDRYTMHIKQNYPLHQIERLAPILQDLRVIKASEEIEQVSRACKITGDAFQRVLKFVQPSVYEFEIEAEITYEFLRQRSSGPAYPSIIAAGKAACVLHYVANNKKCQDGELILMDFGAAYGNYASDLTRTIPVNGTFSPRQKEVYQSVLHILKEATKLLKPGNTFEAYQKDVIKLVEEELIHLKLITREEIEKQSAEHPAYKKYFMHGISHFLGLDVHDVGIRKGEMKAGMLLTCEPGIYIKEEGIGIRLENDILISHHGPVDLMSFIPIEINDIEELMKK
ncbi:MAG TPA: aminopeptidase P N-terminal domain-containing protein [Cytophagaceae bacterium]|jgi:Xaa-Pro aminopeptidase|nr:aminopeptidase P N-terminal domain-containing protein [Cytophagaceae bacterium]